MKKILLSSALILFVGGAVAIGGTGAFFSDTETSSGNIFIAGSIDLKIDHSLSTYNGSSDLVVVSDPATTFTGDDGSGNAVNLSFVHPAWAHNLEPIAHWIWATDPVVAPTTVGRQDTFTRTFVWTGPTTGASLELAADNTYVVTLNGNPVGSNLGEFNYNPTVTFNVSADIVQGVNTLVINVGNLGVANTDPATNPAGLIFKLVVHGQQTWTDPIDLTNQTFWHFDDIKPGDTGRDVISLHVDSNDAWTCMIVNNIQNNENTLIAPEIAAGDTPPAGAGNGELGGFLHLFLWHDTNGDGNFDPGLGEKAIANDPPTFVNSIFTFTSPGPIKIALHDSTTGNGFQAGGSTDDIGSAWCVGVLSVNPVTGVIACDGTDASNPTINRSQTDSTLADLNFYATQVRNQPGFTCASVTLP